jgi:CRISPR-associated protein Cas2
LKIAIFRAVGAQFFKRTHRLIMIDFRNSTPSYDRKLYLLHYLKRHIFVMTKPSYGLQLRQVMLEVTRVQESVFECFVPLPKMMKLWEQVKSKVKDREDSVRFYWIPSDAVPRTLTIGSPLPEPPPDFYII